MPPASWYDANKAGPTTPSAETCGGLTVLPAATRGHTGTTIGAFLLATEFDLATEFGISEHNNEPSAPERTVCACAFLALRRLGTDATVTYTWHLSARTRPHSAALKSGQRISSTITLTKVQPPSDPRSGHSDISHHADGRGKAIDERQK